MKAIKLSLVDENQLFYLSKRKSAKSHFISTYKIGNSIELILVKGAHYKLLNRDTIVYVEES